MSVLPYQAIVAISEGSTYTEEDGQIGLIWPFSERTVIRGKSFGVSHCGYDIRVKIPRDMLGVDSRVYSYNDAGDLAIKLRRNDAWLASSYERICMPNDLVAIVHDKSSWARCFVAVQNTILEPSWSGWVTLEVTTHSEEVTIYDGDPLVQLLFHRLEAPTEKPYTGKYQNQPDEPVPALNEATPNDLTETQNGTVDNSGPYVPPVESTEGLEPLDPLAVIEAEAERNA